MLTRPSPRSCASVFPISSPVARSQMPKLRTAPPDDHASSQLRMAATTFSIGAAAGNSNQWTCASSSPALCRGASSTVSGRRITTPSSSWGGHDMPASSRSPPGRRLRYSWCMAVGPRWLLVAAAPLLVLSAANGASPVPPCPRPVVLVPKVEAALAPGADNPDDAASRLWMAEAITVRRNQASARALLTDLVPHGTAVNGVRQLTPEDRVAWNRDFGPDAVARHL